MTEKIVGYLLVFVGVLTIVASSFNAFNILTKKTNPINFVTNEVVNSFVGEQNIQNSASLNQILNFDNETITFITNLGIHIILLSFILKAGFHLASLGTMLVRPIVVDLNAKNLPKK